MTLEASVPMCYALYPMSASYTLHHGDALTVLQTLPSESVHVCVTSPPYYGLRSYLDNGHEDKRLEVGTEDTPEAYVSRLVDVFREVRRVLHKTGVAFINLGDSYVGGGGFSPSAPSNQTSRAGQRGIETYGNGLGIKPQGDIKAKDLVGIPWLTAFALRADGWYLRSEIIWCLSGGTYVYAKTQKGAMPMMIRDLARLNPATVKLWNGEKWTQLLGVSKSARKSDEIELVLRSGERISCTPTHRFPTRRGLLEASQIQVGDVLDHCRLPEPEMPLSPEHVTEEAAWFAGLYIAEGNRDDKAIHIAGHVREIERLERVKRIAEAYGGTVSVSTTGNGMHIHMRGRMLHGILDMLVTGEGAKKKGFHPNVWRYSNNFLASMLDGYLSGDGHWDAPNKRWRLGFTRNYNLERDLRTVCARLGLHITLKMTQTAYNGGLVPTFRGEIRMDRSGHHNEKDMGEVVEIRKARCREVYDLGVEDEPHLFALASGILTHNSKKAPMPESVTDRPTKAHEQVFLLAKSASYYYDATAIAEPATNVDKVVSLGPKSFSKGQANGLGIAPSGNGTKDTYTVAATRNKRSVWTLGPEPSGIPHFATMPTKLVEPCILAGSSAYGCCSKCGAPWERQVERTKYEPEEVPVGVLRVDDSRGDKTRKLNGKAYNESVRVTGERWQPTCTCGADVVPCTVLDPFAGSGTTLLVAKRLGRSAIGIDLNAEYIEMARKRIEQTQPMLTGLTL